MVSKISETHSMPLHQLIGAPLLAMVQGQAQAAQATAEFIERIGLEWNEDGTANRLRMVSFGYEKPDSDGNMRKFKIEIPLLSLVPIPAIQIKNGELDFSIKINDIKTTSSKTTLSTEHEGAEDNDWLTKEQAEFRASIADNKSPESQSGSSLQMRVKIQVEQAEMSVGITELSRLFQQSIKSSEEPSPEIAPPPSGSTGTAKPSAQSKI